MRITLILFLLYMALVSTGCSSPEERAAAHLQAARELFDAGDIVNAKLEAQNAAQIDPRDAETRYLLALIAEQDGKARDMLQHLLVAVAEDPQMVAARIRLGTLYVFGQAYELAAEQAEAAMALAPEDADARILYARVLLQQGDIESGMAALDAALARNSNHPEALGMKALALQETDPDAALGLLDAAIRRLDREASQPLQRVKLDILSSHGRDFDLEQALLAMIDAAPADESTYRARLARLYRRQGRVDEAEATLRDLAAIAGADIGSRLDVVRFLAEVRAPEAAGEPLQAFIEQDPDNLKLRLALGDLYLGNDQRDQAVAVYRKIAALDAESETGMVARSRLAAESIRDGDTARAAEIVDGILADAPAYPQALLMRAALRFAGRRYEDAIADLRVLLRKEPDNQRALLLMARSQVEAGDVILGKDTYRRLLAANPEHSAAMRELVALMMSDDETEEAQAIIDRLARESDRNSEAAALKVQMLAQQQDWPAAEAAARRLAAGADPNGIGAFQLGQVLEGQRRFGAAAESYTQALDKRPDNIPMLQGLARSLNAQGKHEETLTILRARAKEFPDNTGIRLMLGGALAERGRTAEALEFLESVIADQPGASPAYVAIAALYPADPERRIAAYRRGLSASPANLPLATLLIDEYRRAGRVDEQIELYETLSAAYPDNPGVANNLAALLADYRFGDPAGLERAMALVADLADTDDPMIMDTVGWVYYRGGDTGRAVRYLERAAAANAGIPAVRYHLGMAYLAAGDRVGARRELEMATRENALYEGVEQARAALAELQAG